MPTGSVIRVKEALQEVLDPCSVGRGVPAGLVDMGMVKAVEVGSTTTGHAGVAGQVAPAPAAHAWVAFELRITSPACPFQPYFEREVRERLGGLPGVGEVRIAWDREFDWSDEDMSAGRNHGLRHKPQ